MNFILTAFRSVYSPSFYAAAPRTRFTSALGYFLVLVALLTVVKTAVLVLPGLVNLTPELQHVVDGLGDKFPADLSISIHNGNVTTNVQEPYFIPVEQSGSSTQPAFKNFLVIDTTHRFAVDQFDSYDSLAWLTRDTLVLGTKGSGQFQTYPLAEIGDFKLNRSVVNSWLGAVRPFVGLVAPITGFLALVGLYLVYLGRLLYLLAFAVVILLMLRLLKVRVTYGESYKLGLYAMTTALIVEFLLAVLYPILQFSGFPFMFSAITLVVIAVNSITSRTEVVEETLG